MDKILLAHGSGGKLTHTLIDELFVKKFSNAILDEKSDSAILKSIPKDTELAFTTDSYVINPIFFPGGDIGQLAVCGTINDLAVAGAEARYISCGFIIEEGLDFYTLEKITDSMAKVLKQERVKIVTGDVKVVERKMCDKVFINTSGIGLKRIELEFSRRKILPGDKLLINGSIGEHGIAVLMKRGDFHFHGDIVSDCAPLTGLVEEMLKTTAGVKECTFRDAGIKFMRDPTRGGLATTLNEVVSGMDFGIVLNEEDVPVKEEVRAACEILGLDPLYVANEGKVVVIVSENRAEDMLRKMRAHPLGSGSEIIGEVVREPKEKVLMKTRIGGTRIVDMMVGDQLPRIC